jgi:hypothetical protein
MGKHEKFSLGLENGAEGFRAAWCLELPGCYALIPPGGDFVQRARLAVLEFLAFSHNRAPGRLSLDEVEFSVAQVVETGEDLRGGDTSAFFLHDAEAAGAREFPLWANAHDTALDDLRNTALALPPALLEQGLDSAGRTPQAIVDHAAATERYYAGHLQSGPGPQSRPGHDPTFRNLQDMHIWLQQVVCDVAPATLTRGDATRSGVPEAWSVRKVMRRSVWHLRYHAFELHRAIGSLWLD